MRLFLNEKASPELRKDLLNFHANEQAAFRDQKLRMQHFLPLLALIVLPLKARMFMVISGHKDRREF
jgi:hypothetical protein